MDYPTDFPTESRAAVAAEKLRAGREFDELREKSAPMDHRVRHLLETEIGRYILRQFLVFVLEACKLGHKGIWPVDRIKQEANEFLRRATIDAEYDKGQGVICPRWTDYSRTRIEPEIKRQFERSNEWRQYEDALLQVAEGQKEPAPNETIFAQSEDMTIAATSSAVTAPPEADRRKMVDDFLVQCNQESHMGLKVTRRHLQLVVGHKQPRQFQYWQESSNKATEEDDRSFRRILKMPPAEFIELLNKKGISPSNL